MYRLRMLPLIAALLALALSGGARAADDPTVVADEMTLKAAGIATDGTGLLEFFRNRNRPDLPAKELAALVERLKSDDRAVREKAAVELTVLGPAVVPALRALAADPDLAESAALARRILKTVQNQGTEITAAASRLLLLRKPTGSAEVLLTFLPRAENEGVMEEIKVALSSVAYPDGKPDPTLLKALTNDIPLRRATAIEVLCANGQAEPRATLRKLLDDPVPTVRFRAALALAQTNDIKAFDTLIRLLGDLQPDDAYSVLDPLCSLAGDQAPKAEVGTDAPGRAKFQKEWQKWWDGTEGQAILHEFRRRTLNEGDREKCLKLITTLNDDAFKVREKATEDLKGMGVSIVPLLRQAANHDDPETARRVHDCLELLDKDKSANLPTNLPRLVAVRKPTGAAEALLGYVPFTDDDFGREEIQNALNAVAYTDGKPDKAILPFLTDKSAYRRAAAAVALCQGSLGDNLDAVRKLLKDEDANVRMQAALSLAGARQREAVPVLIALVQELPENKVIAVEEYLARVAGDKKPAGMPEGDAGRPKRRELWAAWWKDNGEKVALVDRYPPQVGERYLGYTVLVQQQNNQVQEVGPDGKVRWTIGNLQTPMDAQVLHGDRVLITESGTQMVTERNLRGDILWKKQVQNWPIGAQRLANGNTVIVSRNQIIEVDRGGKEVFTFNRPSNDIMNAAKTRNGEYVCVSQQGTVFTIDGAGKEVRTYNVGQIRTNANEVLPNGNVIIPGAWQGTTKEYDTTGKVVWEANVGQQLQPMSGDAVAKRQHAGLDGSSPGRVSVVELTSKGQVVKLGDGRCAVLHRSGHGDGSRATTWDKGQRGQRQIALD